MNKINTTLIWQTCGLEDPATSKTFVEPTLLEQLQNYFEEFQRTFLL